MQTIVNTLSSWCNTLCGSKKGFTNNNSMALIGAVVIVAAITGGGFYGYRWYRAGQEEVAQRVFSQNVQEYERVAQEGKKEDWASVETLFKIGYGQYSHSAFAPFFLLYQAEAMIKQDKNDQAREVLAQAVNSMSSSSDVYPLFKIKLALMTLDSNAEQAVAQLKELVHANSHFSDAAAYYLGQYYWMNNDDSKAKEVWQKMIDATKTDKKLGQSPWAALAQEKIAQ